LRFSGGFKDRKHGMQEASTPHEDWLKPHEAWVMFVKSSRG